ncbi:hypothetical protein Forpi1262_v013712 [Fusarium oxysporum f. sp. raphani]|uniref:Up-regulated during septation protein 1 domain-containing protein n=1 Tax=Fusarium oxysporum f. sp. raphani TaxID=96318 RepID=A0A8J5PFJ7_FUSOX|nr:hypothetical protein Forpi1262_v013712 [Fusarium oxysporum f. sp. raphani]
MPLTWGVRQPDPPRKYQLLPKERRLPVLNSRTKDVDVEKAISAPSVPTSDKIHKLALAPSGLKKWLNQYSLIRQRNISVPELGPMTAVQDLAIDSPAIPGRPPFHARSISVPNNLFGKNLLTDTSLYISSDDKGPHPQSHGKEAPQACPQGVATVSPNITNATSCGTPPTPVAAPLMESTVAALKLWDGRYTPPTITTEASSASRGHRRGGLESSGTMGRVLPREGPGLGTNNGPFIQRSEPKRGKSSEQKAFEPLPMGLKQANASEQLGQSELTLLQKKAFDQVRRFDILKAADIETLSKELRHLDERAEYLRHTYNALRIGRRNLHSSICQCLRSSRIAKFSHELLLKQEEVLASLDASIADWAMKLEQAENRRTRVHQKLLEHIAAAASLPVGGLTTTPEHQQTNTPASGTGNISTPSRTLSKEIFTSARPASNSPSPQRAVARVLSTVVEQSIIGKAATREPEQRVTRTASPNRADVESIRIYAGDDLCV